MNEKTPADDEARVKKPDVRRPEPKIDIESLDLSVEEVEERISPSETNVFDK